MSLTCAVKLNCPDCVGVPEREPALDSVKPPAKAPELMLQLYGAVPPVAVSDWLYAVPCVAVAKLVVVIVRFEEASGVIVRVALACLLASATLVALTVAVVLTLTSGAVYSPLLEIVPEDAVHVTDVLLIPVSVAVNCRVPWDATVALLGETEILMSTTVILNSPETAWFFAESVTVTVKLKVPDELGVPVIAPLVALRANPDGRAPLVIAYVYGGVPPVAVSDWL